MFIGHWAPAFIAAAHPKAPKLGTLFIAAQLVDLGFFSLMLLGVEKMRVVPGMSVMNPMDLYHMPYTHSLLGSALWAAGFAAILYAFTKNRTGALIGGAVVLSHWFLDLLVHVPDLTLWGSEPKLGFGLWNHPAIAMPLELGLTFGALFYFMVGTRAVAGTARLTVGLLAILLLTVQMVNWFGPPPGEVTAGAAILVLGTYLLMSLLAAWVGATRVHRNPARG
jgi:membrane-bound metal-dependent hydrolase YbcI (DUF457 family)